MMLESGIMLGALLLFFSIQMSHQATVLDMMPNTFDDQYIGCADEMEQEMPKILKEELKYKQFDVMWEKASQAWKGEGLKLPSTFNANYGIAVVLYTMEKPYPIYRQLNGNISIAGESRDFYMNNFRFKALHFYLTRALQVLRTSCTKKSRVYRGMKIGPVSVAKKMRFSRFASSSKNKTIAEDFGTDPFFSILTCFGVDIDDLSEFEEQEILIPVGETFTLIPKTGSGSTYELESTNQLCSYFNCAYLGGKKRETPVCNSGPAGFMLSQPRIYFIVSGLAATLNLMFLTFI